MKTKLLILTTLFAIGSTLSVEAQRFGKIGNSLKNEVSKSTKSKKVKGFKSTITKKIGSKEINIPYTDITSYLEYVDGSNEDEVVEGIKNYYVYIWIPVAVNEIGIRMKSPVGKTKVKNAIASDDYNKNADSKDVLDQFISLHRSNIKNSESISLDDIANATWTEMYPNAHLDDNDDTTEEARFINKANDPLNVLARGLYRVSFRTYDHDGVKGTFLGQIGFPVKIPGIAMSRDIEELKKKLDL